MTIPTVSLFRMLARRGGLPALVAACVLTLGLLAPVALAAPTPGQIVAQNSARVLHTLSERRAEFQADPEALRTFIRSEFNKIFDRAYAARMVLGRNARGASDAEVRGFADALAENLMQRYGNSLLEVDPGLNVRVLSETPLRNGTIIRVVSQITRKSGAPVPVDYLFRQNDGQWQVFDVIVEGVSFVQTFRSQFADDLRTKSLGQVTADLRAGKVQVDASTE